MMKQQQTLTKLIVLLHLHSNLLDLAEENATREGDEQVLGVGMDGIHCLLVVPVGGVDGAKLEEFEQFAVLLTLLVPVGTRPTHVGIMKVGGEEAGLSARRDWHAVVFCDGLCKGSCLMGGIRSVSWFRKENFKTGPFGGREGPRQF